MRHKEVTHLKRSRVDGGTYRRTSMAFETSVSTKSLSNFKISIEWSVRITEIEISFIYDVGE